MMLLITIVGYAALIVIAVAAVYFTMTVQTRSASPAAWWGRLYGLLAAVPIFLIGVSSGWIVATVHAPRTNTVAAMAYTEALDLQTQAAFARRVAENLAVCQAEVGQAHATATTVVAAAQIKMQETAETLSERIVGLREQLRANGIKEVVVDTR